MARAKDSLITDHPSILSEDTAPKATSMSAPLRILYVEDNAIVREITSELLAQDQRQIVSCATAEEALKAFATNPFDLVITDVSLPAMSGIELAHSILALEPRARIILASGYDLDFGVENRAANVRSIIKPFEAAEIEALMSELLRA